MTEMAREESCTPSYLHLLLVYVAWILITEVVPMLSRPLDPGPVLRWVLAGVRMAVMLLLTFGYIRLVEKRPFLAGFNLRLGEIGSSLLWGVVFFIITGAVLLLYEFLIVRPITAEFVVASSGITSGNASPFLERLVEYSYIVFEQIVEVLIFIGFLLDRLAKRVGFLWAILLSNLGFALWHYDYLSSGLLQGALMMVMVLLAGMVISLSYVKTKNSLSPIICGTLVDSPMAIRILLGMH